MVLDTAKSKINEFASIKKIENKNTIAINEIYTQFLWVLSYCSTVLFDEGLQMPMMKNKFTGAFDMTNKYVLIVKDLFAKGMECFQRYVEPVEFYSFPNPEKYSFDDSTYEKYIRNANGVYVGALTFVFLHEFGHQYYSHISYCPNEMESKKEEIIADEYAYEKMAQNFDKPGGRTLMLGIIVGVASLVLCDKTLKGGDLHPDPDRRLQIITEKMNLAESDPFWGIAYLIIILWSIYYDIEIDSTKREENYKKLFYSVLSQIQHVKGF